MKEENDKKTSVSPPPPPEPTSSRSQSGIRRTERVKRDKPDFYNASEYDKQRKVIFFIKFRLQGFKILFFFSLNLPDRD